MGRPFFQKFGKILIELLIVFVGVYLAFQLNNFKEEKEKASIKNNYYRVLANEFESTANNLKQVSSQLNEFISLIESGKEPSLLNVQKLDLNDNMYILKSAFNSGYFENIDSKYINNIARGSNYLTKVATLLDNYNRRVESVLIINDFNNSVFYNEDGSLKNNYGWCKEDLKYIIYYLQMLQKVIVEEAIPDTKSLTE